MKTSLMPTWQPTYHGSEDNPEGELAAYKLLLTDIKDEVSATEQKGKKAFGIEATSDGLEVTVGDDQELVEYGVDLAMVVPDRKFELLVRKESSKALQNLPEKNLRSWLRKLLETI
jgi:hypothetical protein